ncbi:MAG: phosphatidylserine decarboxylase [Lachnospiraceae bacterium]|nr:phosphatidylserine decarboxylase [Lachnospiraceae bacterium]
MGNKRKSVHAGDKGIQDSILRFLYQTKPGSLLLKVLVNPYLSKAAGCFMDSRFSVPLIKPFIKYNNINMEDYEKCGYNSFNEFFTRKIKKGRRDFSVKEEDLCSPCDARLSVFKIGENSTFMVKGTYYNMESLVKSHKLAQYYKEGTLCIFRLCVDDYHRYSYIDGGKQKKNYKIPGVLHTVNPIACGKYPVYKENSREFSILNSKNFGKVLMMEVGAMLVGRICNYNDETYAVRGQEKGRFEYGGSTVILAFARDMVTIDKEILDNSRYGFETIVQMGSVIGKKAVKKPGMGD